jgi:hypothetical protein
MATTSFMVRPSFALDRDAGGILICAAPKSGIFLCKWHKKFAALSKNNCRNWLPLSSLACTGIAAVGQDAGSWPADAGPAVCRHG